MNITTIRAFRDELEKISMQKEALFGFGEPMIGRQIMDTVDKTQRQQYTQAQQRAAAARKGMPVERALGSANKPSMVKRVGRLGTAGKVGIGLAGAGLLGAGAYALGRANKAAQPSSAPPPPGMPVQ